MAETIAEKTRPEVGAEAEAEEDGGSGWSDVAFIVFVGAMLLLNVTGVFREIFGIDTAVILTFVGGYRIFGDSISRLLRGKIGGDLAVTIAAFAALAIGEYAAAAEVILIMLIGGALEEFAVEKTRSAIGRLMKLAPPVATVRRDGREAVVPIEEVAPGDLVLVRPGERVPVDGAVAGGRSSVDQSALTGESMPVDKAPGDPVFTGTINLMGLLEIGAERVGPDTTLAQVIRLVEEAEERKAPIERLADRWSGYFVPVVLCAAGLVLLLTGQVTRMIAALIVACPCALILATPTAIAAGIGRLAKCGTLLKGGAYLEEIGRIDCVVFDKTGTLTEGRAQVAAVLPFDSRTPAEILTLAATAEQGSTHPIALAILAAWRSSVGDPLDEAGLNAQRSTLNAQYPIPNTQHPTPLPVLDAFRFEPGLGIEARQNGRVILVGNRALLERGGIVLDGAAQARVVELEATGRTAVLVTEGEQVAGAIAVEDRLRPDAAETVAALKALGIRHTVMLTGDSERVAREAAGRLGLDEVAAELFPDGKVARVRQLQADGYRVAMLGDGINDAPSLAAANVGIAMGKAGTDIAVAAADVVFMTDELARLPETIVVSRRVLATIRQNILWFAIALNSAGVLGAATGLVTPLMAAVGHQIASLCVVCNSLRLLFRFRISDFGFRIWRRPAADTLHGRVGTPADSARSRISRAILAAIPCQIRNPKSEIRNLLRHRSALLRGASAVILAGWIGSGLYTIRTGQVGVVRRFGRRVEAQVPPGLHYRLPWPVEQVARVDVGRVRRLEVGFRSVTAPSRVPTPPLVRGVGPRPLLGLGRSPAAPPASEPAAYEWNTRHQAGFQKRPDESLMLTGDEYLVEVNATVQYRVARPSEFLFAVADPEGLLRQTAETAIREAVGRTPLEAVLTGGRAQIEAQIRERAQAGVDRNACGLEILAVRLQDVHPPVEVVDTFRDVASALEEKGRRINLAEAERNARVPAARAEAARNVIAAAAYTTKRVREANGDANRFIAMAGANRAGPQVTRIRLYLETVEQVLAGPRKFIADAKHGRRQMFLIDGQTPTLVPGGSDALIPGLTMPAPRNDDRRPTTDDRPPTDADQAPADDER